MGTVANTTLLSNRLDAMTREALLVITGSASYATGGDTIDLSAVTGGGFTKVYGVQVIGQPTAASDRYHITFVPAAAYAAATGKLKIRDLNATDSAAEVSNTADLSSVTWVVRVTGV